MLYLFPHTGQIMPTREEIAEKVGIREWVKGWGLMPPPCLGGR